MYVPQLYLLLDIFVYLCMTIYLDLDHSKKILQSLKA